MESCIRISTDNILIQLKVKETCSRGNLVLYRWCFSHKKYAFGVRLPKIILATQPKSEAVDMNHGYKINNVIILMQLLKLEKMSFHSQVALP